MRLSSIVLSLSLAVLMTETLRADVVRTIAGTGKGLHTGDGGPATQAGVAGPFGLTIGPDGALYVCETESDCVRRVDLKTGLISTVAGNGKKGYAGDGGPALEARCNEPYEVRFDADGNMYFVEMRNHVVRRVDAKTQKISTVAGTGAAGFSGDGGAATAATLNTPHSIALDHAGNLYIADIGNHRVRMVKLSDGTISTFAGNGKRAEANLKAPLTETPLNGPRALDIDAHGQLFLALREGNAVYRIDLQSKQMTHLAGTQDKGDALKDGIPAIRAKLYGPKGIAVGPNGDVYLADTESHTIRVILAKTGTIETLVGDGKKGDGPDGNPNRCRLDRPHGIYVDSAGDVYIGDSSNHRVRKLTLERVQ